MVGRGVGELLADARPEFVLESSYGNTKTERHEMRVNEANQQRNPIMTVVMTPEEAEAHRWIEEDAAERR